MDNCKTIILLVGGNDAENGTDLERFAAKYGLLLNFLLADIHRVIVAGQLPRETVDLSAYNNKLRQLCDVCDTEFVENYQNFLLASGELPESYYSRDKIHLNYYGTRNIDKVHRVTAHSQASVPDRSGRMYRPAYRANTVKGRPGNNNNTIRVVTYLPNIVIYLCVTDMLHKSVGSTVGMRVGRCVSRGRDTMSV